MTDTGREQVWFNQKQFAARIGRTPRWLRKMDRCGLLKPKRIGGALLYCDEMLNESSPPPRREVRERVRELIALHKAGG